MNNLCQDGGVCVSGIDPKRNRVIIIGTGSRVSHGRNVPFSSARNNQPCCCWQPIHTSLPPSAYECIKYPFHIPLVKCIVPFTSKCERCIMKCNKRNIYPLLSCRLQLTREYGCETWMESGGWFKALKPPSHLGDIADQHIPWWPMTITHTPGWPVPWQMGHWYP